MIGWILAHPESAVLFFTAFLAICFISAFKKDFFSPMNLYFLSQTLMVGGAYLKLNSAMTDFRFITWLFWIGGMISFLSGCWLIHLMFKSYPTLKVDFPLQLHQNYNWDRHIVLSFMAFCFFLIGVFGVISVAGNLILLTDQPWKWVSGTHSAIGKYALFFGSSPMLVGLFGVASFKSINPSKKYRIISRVMILTTICLSFMTYPNRGITLIALGFIFILYNYLGKRISFKWILFSLCFVFVVFNIVASIKGQVASDIMTSKNLNFVMELPYKYIANNYWNFDYALNQPSDQFVHDKTYGVDFFYGFTSLIRVGDALRTSFDWDSPFNESVVKITGLNTIHYLWDSYKDFGVLGIFLVPFLFGLCFTFLYRNLSIMKTPAPLLFHTMFSFWILLWSFTTGYKQAMYIVWMPFFLLIPLLCQQKHTKNREIEVE